MDITVTGLSVTPIKGTRIHTVDSVSIGAQGARGDRAFYVIDATGAMINAKRAAVLQTVIADYAVDDERLSLTLPDGSQVVETVALGAEVETTFFGAERAAREVDGPWSAALSQVADEPLRLVAGGSAVDRGAAGAVSLVSRGSLRRLGDEDDGAAIDPRRFRMLIEIDGIEAHEEDSWLGRELMIGNGDGVRLVMRGHVGRCATTTRSPDTAEVDYPTLKLLAEYRLDEPTSEPLAFGVHGAVLSPGIVRVGDPVHVGASVGDSAPVE